MILFNRFSIQHLIIFLFLAIFPFFVVADETVADDTVASKTVVGDVAIGKEKAIMCTGCHGEQGISVSPQIPNLAGQKKEYLINTIKDFRAGVRKNPIMNSMVKTLTDSDVENLAAYFSSLEHSSPKLSTPKLSTSN